MKKKRFFPHKENEQTNAEHHDGQRISVRPGNFNPPPQKSGAAPINVASAAPAQNERKEQVNTQQAQKQQGQGHGKKNRHNRHKSNRPKQGYIPPDYLPDEAERLKMYKQLISADRAQTKALLAHLADQSGPAPQELKNLVAVLELSNQAGSLGIYHVDWTENALELQFTKHTLLPPDLPEKLLFKYGPEGVQFLQSKNGYGLRLLAPQKTPPLLFTQQVLSFLTDILIPQK